ncbi:MAG: hypothetical protein Q8O67_25985 [Deltaproteobacteria bacterium]|nr:hypothetical protein [Deltaproteobacteria bacterium]
MFFLLLLLSASVDDEAGFGGAVEEPVVEEPATVPSDERDFRGGTAPAATTTSTFPAEVPALPPPKTKLEIELEQAKIDATRFPLIMLRVDVARLVDEFKRAEGAGLSAARDIELKLEYARGLLGDAERIGLHRMMVCSARTGRSTSVKNFRMTAAGPVRLTNAELIGQTSVVDPDGCARIELVDQALVDRLKRAHEVKKTLDTVAFPYHRIAERRALEAELKLLQKQLAQEDLPVLTMPGMKDPYGN